MLSRWRDYRALCETKICEGSFRRPAANALVEGKLAGIVDAELERLATFVPTIDTFMGSPV